MGFKEGILTLLFIFLAISFIRPLSASLGAAGAIFRGPTGALVAVGLFLYVVDAFLDRQGTTVPVELIRGISGITTEKTPKVYKHISGESAPTLKRFPFGTPPTQVGRSGSFSRNFFRKR